MSLGEAALGTAVDRTRLDETLANRRWTLRLSPFPHFIATRVFTNDFYRQLEREFLDVLGRGLADTADPAKFSRNMQNSDAYSWNFPADINGGLSLFYSRDWHDMLTNITKTDCTLDVNGALHHHQLLSKNGSIHKDVGIGWFSDQPRADGVNPMDLRRCAYTTGRISGQTSAVRQTVRAVTMIFYLANPPWKPGVGGETGLYTSMTDPVDAAASAVPPVNNTMLIFENTPESFHSFISNTKQTRNSLILWLHRTVEETNRLWPSEPLYSWKQKKAS